MSKYLDTNGLLYLWGKIKAYVSEHGGGTADSVDWSNILNKPDVALKSDLSSVYRYKGSVANYASLPAADNVVGDVWNVEARTTLLSSTIRPSLWSRKSRNGPGERISTRRTARQRRSSSTAPQRRSPAPTACWERQTELFFFKRKSGQTVAPFWM